ncbi:ribonuclease III [Kribbia dieselivorans]|uniref:ribonuclease III n=1 Tax=Kribbia dieselivorans TaxID=331526 RepID=UPI0008395725|nr:ribonuclease III [Kribbia dieselivorans]
MTRARKARQWHVEEFSAYLTEVVGGVVDAPLLERALTHRSYAFENGGIPHNERLEFLGDAVLGLVVTDTLFRTHPDLPEGQLAKFRAAVVNMRALADVARTIGLGEYVRVGRGEEATGGRDKTSILADTVEAVIGATYISLGQDAAATLIHTLLDPVIAQAATLGAGLDWKTSLQESVNAHGLDAPVYASEKEGPDHARTYRATVSVEGDALGHGSGRTKKDAEMQAAEEAWRALQTRFGEPSATGGSPAHA